MKWIYVLNDSTLHAGQITVMFPQGVIISTALINDPDTLPQLPPKEVTHD